MNIRCSECRESVVDMTKENSWGLLYNFITFLNSEETISENTCNLMINALMDLKEYAYESKSELEVPKPAGPLSTYCN